jgi:hypothetical protein
VCVLERSVSHSLLAPRELACLRSRSLRVRYSGFCAGAGMGPCAFLELLSLGGWASGGELLTIAHCPILCRAARLRRQGSCCDHSDRGCVADEMSSSTYIVTQGVGRAKPSTMTMIDVRVESSKLSGLSEDLLIWTL